MKRALLITVACLAVGVVLGLALVGADVEVLPHDVEDRYFAAFTAHVVAGLAAYAALPLALRHVPREEDPDYPGTRGTLVAACLVALSSFSYFATPATVVALVATYSRRSTRWSVAVTVSVAVSFGIDAALSVWIDNGYDAWTLLGIVLLVVPTLLYGTARGRRRERQARLIAQAQLNQELVRARESAARDAERQRIARDMHDSLSHRLSLIALHSGALAYRQDLPPEKMAEAASTIRDEAEAAVEDLRQVLTALRETTPLPTIEALTAQEHVTVTGTEPRWGTLAAQAAARAVQEGLTNARKHAPGAPVTVSFGEDSVTMSNPNSAPRGTGHGLTGMAERAGLAGGNFEILSETPEFAWRMTLPVKERA